MTYEKLQGGFGLREITVKRTRIEYVIVSFPVLLKSSVFFGLKENNLKSVVYLYVLFIICDCDFSRWVLTRDSDYKCPGRVVVAEKT